MPHLLINYVRRFYLFLLYIVSVVFQSAVITLMKTVMLITILNFVVVQIRDRPTE